MIDTKLLKSYGINNLYDAVKSTYELLKTINDPKQADVRYGINRLVRQDLSEVTQADLEAAFAELPTLRRLYDEGYDPVVNTDRLMLLPQGTLGREFATFLRTNKIAPLDTLLSRAKMPLGPEQYVALRAYKLHDVLHVVMGCDTSVLGEVQIVSFSLAQGGGRAAAIALGVLLLHLAIKNPDSMPHALKTAHAWYAKGREFGYHLPFRFEDHWGTPVADVREALRTSQDRVRQLAG